MALLNIPRPGPASPELEHKWFHRFLNLQLAHDGVMLEDAQQALALNRSIAAGHAKATAFKNGSVEAPEDSMVHIGDQVTNQFSQKGLGTIGKILLSAALMATGAGAGVGGALLMNTLKAAPAAFTDTNSLFDFDIVNPDK